MNYEKNKRGSLFYETSCNLINNDIDVCGDQNSLILKKNI